MPEQPRDTFDERANGTLIEVQVGGVFAVRLEENPTTGFRWRPEAAGVPSLELLGDEFEPSTPSVPGRPGHHVWRFRAAHVGAATIRLGYRRRAGPDVRVFALRVEVR